MDVLVSVNRLNESNHRTESLRINKAKNKRANKQKNNNRIRIIKQGQLFQDSNQEGHSFQKKKNIKKTPFNRSESEFRERRNFFFTTHTYYSLHNYSDSDRDQKFVKLNSEEKKIDLKKKVKLDEGKISKQSSSPHTYLDIDRHTHLDS